MVALARRFGTNVRLLSGQWYCSGTALCVFEGVLSLPRRREMDVALPYASWDTVRMKWRPSLKGVHNCYEICTRLRRTMKTMTRKIYRQVVIILKAGRLEGDELVGRNQVMITSGGPRLFLNRRRRSTATTSQANFSFASQPFSIQRPQPPKASDLNIVLYTVSLLCRASRTVRCTTETSPRNLGLACSATAGPIFISPRSTSACRAVATTTNTAGTDGS
jgi:hypothetical protein